MSARVHEYGYQQLVRHSCCAGNLCRAWFVTFMLKSLQFLVNAAVADALF